MPDYNIVVTREVSWSAQKTYEYLISADDETEAHQQATYRALGESLPVSGADEDDDHVTINHCQEAEDLRASLGLSEDDMHLWDWVCQAMHKDFSRKNICYLHAINGKIEATNGHLLLQCDLNVADGCYSCMGSIIINDAYPDTARLWRDTDVYEELVITNHNDKCMQICGKATLNSDYYRMAVGDRIHDWVVSFGNDPATDSLQFSHKHKSQRAIIMPMFYEWKEAGAA